MASETVQTTLALLEERLLRIQHVLQGSDLPDSTAEQAPNNTSAVSRLAALERQLNALAAHSSAVSDVLALQKAQPPLFHPSASAPDDEANILLPTSTLAELVLAHSSQYMSTSSQLTMLQSTSLPDPASLNKLVEVIPRIAKVQAKQEAQIREVAELRMKSAKVVEEWYESGVLEMGGRWADWEERIRDCEILVRRKEAVKRRIDEGVI